LDALFSSRATSTLEIYTLSLHDALPIFGVVDLESPHAGSFTDEHVRVLSTLAPQIAIAIENARLYEQVAKSEGRMERDLQRAREDRKSTRLNSSHDQISYAVFCLKKKKK